MYIKVSLLLVQARVPQYYSNDFQSDNQPLPVLPILEVHNSTEHSMLASMDRSQRDGPISKATKGVGSLIGLAIEAHIHHKAKKSASTMGSNVRYSEDKPSLSSLDEDSPLPPAYCDSTPVTNIHTAIPSTTTPLPLPIIIPQRRPSTSSRGFVPVYCSDLLTHESISQDEFIAFLTTLNSSFQSSPTLRAINIGAMAAGFVPSAIAIATSLSVQIAVRNVIKVQVSRRTESALDKANREMFWPRGRHAFITTFVPGQKDSEFIDVDTNQSFQRNAGQKSKAIELPESAPLILLDSGNSSPSPNSSMWSRSSQFLSTYFDKRAQASKPSTYSNITSSDGSMPAKPRFASRWADPNHPAHSGSPLALLTGGLIDPRLMLAERRQGSGSSRDGPRSRPSERCGKNDIRTDDQGKRVGSLGEIIKKVAAIEDGVLYLVIAWIPEDMKEEINRALATTA
jgi:hypothetical protein